MAEEIEFTIDENGQVEIEANGFKGKGCAKVIDELAKAIGTKVKTTLKQDYYQPEDTKIKQKIARF